MSVYGYQRATTPSLSAFARECYVFDSAFAQWPKTAPAFASIVSAKYGHTTGVMRITPNQVLPPDHQTLSEVLDAAGYETAAFLSSPALNNTTNIAQGHKVYEELFGRRVPNAAIAPTDRALAFAKQTAATGKPFYIWAHFNNAHYPYNGGGANPEMFVGDKFYDGETKIPFYTDPSAQLDIKVSTRHPSYNQITRADLGGVHFGAVPRTPDGALIRPNEYGYYLARYDSGIYGADYAIGKLLAGLRDQGRLNDTLIVIVGDHGESLGENSYFFEHARFPYDNNAHVVYMIRPPGGVKETRIADPVPAFSVAPTILDVLGITPPKEWEARSVLAAAKSGSSAEPVFTEVGFQFDYMLVARDQRWKLIHIPNEMDRRMLNGVEWELYDWRSDPTETVNQFTAQPEAAARLQGVLASWSKPWVERAYQPFTARRVKLDGDTNKQMKDLGYVGDVPEEDEDPTKPQRKRVPVPPPESLGVNAPRLPNPAAKPTSRPSSAPAGK